MELSWYFRNTKENQGDFVSTQTVHSVMAQGHSIWKRLGFATFREKSVLAKTYREVMGHQLT